MNPKSNKGSVAVAAWILWIGGAAAVGYVIHEYGVLTSPGRNKKGADASATSSANTANQAVVVYATAQDVQKAVDTAVAAVKTDLDTHNKMEANAAGFSYAAKGVLSKEKNPSARVQLATTLSDSAFQSLGAKLAPDQKALWDAIIADRDEDKATIAARDATISSMTVSAAAVAGSLDATEARAKAAEATAQVLTTVSVTQAKELKESAKESASLSSQVKAWADREPDFIMKIKALGVLLALAAGLLIWYEIHRRGVDGTLKDAVALKEHLKSALVTATNDAPAVEAKIATWWGGAKADEAKVEAVVQKLRL